jgi:dipeptidase D
MAMAVLDSDLDHPALEVLITTDEEKGMTGADKLDGSLFKSKYLINLDSEEEGVFTAGCAGGSEIDFKIPLKIQDTKKSAYKICVKGLSGGHSGSYPFSYQGAYHNYRKIPFPVYQAGMMKHLSQI